MPTQYTVTRESLAAILDAADLDATSLHTHYRRPGMGGCTCLGLVGSTADLARFLLAAGAVLDIDHAVQLFGSPQQDSLALDMIWYWPRTAVSGEGIGRDGQWVDGSPDPLHVLM